MEILMECTREAFQPKLKYYNEVIIDNTTVNPNIVFSKSNFNNDCVHKSNFFFIEKKSIHKALL